MGYYIEVQEHFNKAQQIVEHYGGKIVTKQECDEAIKDPTKGVIVVVRNQFFEAAGFCFSEQEYKAFNRPEDTRHRDFVIMDRALAEELSGYTP